MKVLTKIMSDFFKSDLKIKKKDERDKLKTFDCQSSNYEIKLHANFTNICDIAKNVLCQDNSGKKHWYNCFNEFHNYFQNYRNMKRSSGKNVWIDLLKPRHPEQYWKA